MARNVRSTGRYGNTKGCSGGRGDSRRTTRRVRRTLAIAAATASVLCAAPAWANPEPSDDLDELDYEKGDPIPPGYSKVSRGYPVVTVFGGVLFGGGWLASTAVGVLASVGSSTIRGNDGASWMLLALPLAGPFVSIGVQDAAAKSGATAAGLAIDGITQCVGLAMLIAGTNLEHEVLVRTESSQMKLTVAPTSYGRSGGGVHVSGTF